MKVPGNFTSIAAVFVVFVAAMIAQSVDCQGTNTGTPKHLNEMNSHDKRKLCHINNDSYEIELVAITARGIEVYPNDHQAAYRGGFSTEDHSLSLALLLETSAEWNVHLWLGLVDSEKLSTQSNTPVSGTRLSN